MESIIHESSTSQKKYKCPYCTDRYIRQDLIYHISRKHEDMIPQSYTSTRVVFNLVNKKDHGNCTECGRVTPWNEETGRYERICPDRPQCTDSYIKKMRNRMVNVYGKASLLGDDDQQTKMLANRKISGTYKFSTGGSKVYTGSYEKNALEYQDKVMGIRARDLVMPGPIVEYVDQYGETRRWITDQYYIPFNLIIEIKDGGDNPNKRNMKDYRAKQISKEEAIIKQKQYNYIRLTNNQFDQLRLIFVELKMQLLDGIDEKIIHINENMSAMMGALPNRNATEIYVAPYILNNSFSGIAVSPDRTMNRLISIDTDRKLSVLDIEDIQEYSLYKVKNPDISGYTDILKSIGDYVDDQYIPNKILGVDILSADQLLFMDNLTEVTDMSTDMDILESVIESTLDGHPSAYYESIKNLDENSLPDSVTIMEDSNGSFFINKETGLRSKDMRKESIKLIESGMIL